MYFEDNITINYFLKANVGLHYSAFMVENQFYNSLQPRLGLRLLINDKLSFKAGFAAMSQNIHLLSNNNISLPTDLWVPVTKRIKPMNSNQYSAGVFYNLLNTIDLSVEGYYKTMIIWWNTRMVHPSLVRVQAGKTKYIWVVAGHMV